MTIRFAIINKVVDGVDIPAQFAHLAAIGYDGVELGTPTLGPAALDMTVAQRAEIRRAAADAGIEIVGFHQILSIEEGLSITVRDAGVRAHTLDVMRRSIALCGDLGGRLLVHGSPRQRAPDTGETVADAVKRCTEAFAIIAGDAVAAGVSYLIEPLSAGMTPVINTVDEAMAVVDAVSSPGVATMIDTLAANSSDTMPVPALVDRWMPSGNLRHIHFNDRNRRAPGQGDDRFVAILAALRRNSYRGYVTVEPFEYFPDGRAQAAWALGYLRAATEALDDAAAETATG